MNHYLATHTFHSDKIKKEYYRSIKSRKNNDWFAEINNPDHPLHEKAKVVQVFIGREDFFSVIGMLRVKGNFGKINKSRCR